MKRVRRVAAHTIVTDHETVDMGVVEIEDGVVVGYAHLTGEQPQTEWIGGTITLKPDADGRLRAYHNGKNL